MVEFVRGILPSRAIREQDEHEPRSVRETAGKLLGLLRRRPALQAFMFANVL
jgi:hypothetical protein